MEEGQVNPGKIERGGKIKVRLAEITEVRGKCEVSLMEML